MYSCCSLILFGVGNTIGCGIFAYTGLAAQYAGGPAVFLSYLVAGFASLMTALVYAEFGSRFPKSGSSYYYSSMFQGEGISWIIAWNLNLRYGCYAATISRAWGSYFMEFFKLLGFPLPKFLNNYECGPFDFSILAPLCMLLCCWI
jgi:amino acid transporter